MGGAERGQRFHLARARPAAGGRLGSRDGCLRFLAARIHAGAPRTVATSLAREKMQKPFLVPGRGVSVFRTEGANNRKQSSWRRLKTCCIASRAMCRNYAQDLLPEVKGRFVHLPSGRLASAKSLCHAVIEKGPAFPTRKLFPVRLLLAIGPFRFLLRPFRRCRVPLPPAPLRDIFHFLRYR